MNEWASRRKSIYLAIVVVFFTLLASLLFWKFWYSTPTCSDGLKNGDETGIDCGGSCSMICSAEALPLVIRSDPRVFEVIQNVWSTIIYIENQNSNLDASYVPYTFYFYDEQNNLLYKREGITVVPKNKTSAIFEGSINIESGKKVKRVTFELGKDISWSRNSFASDELAITHSSLLREETAPRVEARVKNESIEDIEDIELVISVFDGADNTIAASRTFIDKLNKNSSTDVFFTWPRPFDLGVKVCEKPSNTVLLLDRSGSMSSLGSNPPEPLTSVKTAAASFVDELGDKDRVSVVSFATNVKDPIESTLTNSFDLVKKAIGSIEIEKGTTQYTNIYDALRVGFLELESKVTDQSSSKVMILLTDGVANYPKNPQGKNTEDDTKHAEALSLEQAVGVKQAGVDIYTIGLGKDINESFLKQLASDNNKYFFSPTTKELREIYKNISSNICKQKPAKVDITYKILR